MSIFLYLMMTVHFEVMIMIDECNICGSNKVEFVSNKVIYGKVYGNGKAFMCMDCESFVGCHDSGKPYGILSDKPMRELRKKCHRLFDPIWKGKMCKRGDLYKKLANVLGIRYNDCHFGMFDMEMLEKAHSILSEREWWIWYGK